MKKKLSIIAIALLLLLALTFSLVACKPTEEEEEKPQGMTQRETLDMVMAGHGFGEEAVLSTNFAIGVDVKGEKYNVAIKTNLNAKQSEIFVEINNVDNVKVLGVYIIGGRIYLDLGANNAKLYLADFDVSDVAQMLLEKDWISEFDGLLGDTGFDFDGILDLLAEVLFSKAVVTKEGDLDVYTMNIKFDQLMDMVNTMIGEINLNKIIFNAGININFDFNELLLNLSIPKDLTMKFISKMNGDKTVSTNIVANMAEAALFDISLDGGVFDSLQDLGFPADIATYVPFSLTNICFDATLNLTTDKLDLADIVNMLTGGKTLPKDVLIFNSNKDFSVKFRMDLDIDDNMKNLVFIDIFAGKNFDSKLVGIYFTKGVLYIDYASVMPNGTKLPNMKIENIDISKELRNMIQMISGTIAADPTAPQGVTSITTKTSDNVLSPDLISFAQSVINLVGVNENVKVEGNKVSIKINQALFNMLKSVISAVDITYPEFLGDIDVDINLSQAKGIDNVNITANLPDYNSIFSVNLNNFNIGFTTNGIDSLIDESIKDKSFITDYSEILNKAMEGTRIQGQLKINLPKGEYDLSDFFKALNLNIPSIKYELTDNIVDELFDIDMKMQLDVNNKDNNEMSIEIKAVRDNAFCKAGLFIGLYHKNNAMYLDASNITIAGLKLPIMKIDVDFASMLTQEIAKLGYGNLYAEAGNPISIPDQNKSSITAVNDIIEANIDNNKLVILATSKAIANILAANGIEIQLPEFTVSGEIISMNDIKIKLASGELNVDLDVTNIAVGEKQTFDFEIVEDTYYEDLIIALTKKLANLDMATTIDITSKEGKLDVTNFINGILSATGNNLQVPIEFVMANYSSRVDLNIKWNIDETNSANTELVLEMLYGNNAKTLMFGFYLYGDNAYINIPSISAKFRVENLGLAPKLGEALGSLKANIALNIGDILADLLAGREINTKPKTNGLTNMADGLVLPADFVQYLFDGISIKNTTFGINYSAELLRKMLLSIGVDTTANATLSGSIDVVAGTLNLKGTLGILTLDINSRIVTLGEKVTTGMNDELFKDFLTLDAASGVTLTDTLFSQMSPSFNIDIYNRSVDLDGGNKYTRITLRKSGKVQKIMGVDLQPDDLVLALKDESKLGNDKVCIYILITDRNLHIRGTDDWFSELFGQIKGSKIAVDFPMDVKSMLYGVLDEVLKIIKPAETAPQGITSNMADGNAAADLGVLSKIEISMMDTDQLRISIKFNAEKFNTMISDTINNFLQTTQMEGVDLSKIVYSTDKGTFINGIWSHFLTPFIKSSIKEEEWFLAKGTLESKFKELLQRLFPFPNADEAFINVNIDQNKLSSLEINIRDNANSRYTEIDIVNTAAEGAIDWATEIDKEYNCNNNVVHFIVDNKIQATNIEYDPYGITPLSAYFNKKARSVVGGVYKYEDIVWTYNNAAFDPSKAAETLVYREDGLPYEIVGTAFGKSITVNVKVLSSTNIVGVKPITTSAYNKLPSTVEIMLADGTTREVTYSSIAAAPSTYKAHTVKGKVTLQGKEYDVDVNYLDSTVKYLLGGTNLYKSAYEYGLGNYLLADYVNIQFQYGGHINIKAEYDYSELTGSAITAEGAVRNVKMIIAKGTALEQIINLIYTITPKVVANIEFNSVSYDKYNVDPYEVFTKGIDAYNKKATVHYADGSSEELELVWDITNVNNTYLGANSTAKVSYTAGTVSWEREVTVAMARRDAMYLDFNGDKVIEVNPLMWEQLGKDYYFPANAKVVFETGESAILPITWDLSKFDISNPSGSFNNITATIANGDFEQTVQVPVRVKPVRPTGVVLENNKYTIDPINVLYKGEAAFSEKLMIKFADDRQEEVNVVWNAKDVVINLNGGNYSATVGVGAFNFAITVEVKNCSDIALKDNTLSIDPLTYAVNNGAGAYADTLTYTSNGVEYELPVVWNTDAVTVDKVGGNYTAKATIGSGDKAIISDVAVTVLNREIESIGLTDNTVKVAVGENVNPQFTVTFKDGSTMTIDAIIGAFDNTVAGTYENVTVTFFNDYESIKQTFTITVIVEDSQPEIVA